MIVHKLLALSIRFIWYCDMLVPCKALNGTHKSTSQCTQGAEQKRRKLWSEEEREFTARAFSAYWPPL